MITIIKHVCISFFCEIIVLQASKMIHFLIRKKTIFLILALYKEKNQSLYSTYTYIKTGVIQLHTMHGLKSEKKV